MNGNNKIIPHLLPMAVVGLLFAGSLSAQPGRGGHQRPEIPDAEGVEQIVAEMDAALSLTEKQESEVSRLFTAHFDEARELVEANKDDRQTMDALRKELEDEIGNVLTDEQREAYEKLMEDRRPQQRGQGPGRR